MAKITMPAAPAPLKIVKILAPALLALTAGGSPVAGTGPAVLRVVGGRAA
jgi:hypothetical protein